MHLLNVATIFTVLSLVGVEFSVSAFVNPAAWRLDAKPQLEMLARFGFVLGKVMPVWYPICVILLTGETWLHRRTPDFAILLAADALWVLTSAASIVLLVPLNSRVAARAADWQRIHKLWDRRHRVRVAALAISAFLLTYVLAR